MASFVVRQSTRSRDEKIVDESPAGMIAATSRADFRLNLEKSSHRPMRPEVGSYGQNVFLFR
jgi:hypothetical protein